MHTSRLTAVPSTICSAPQPMPRPTRQPARGLSTTARTWRWAAFCGPTTSPPPSSKVGATVLSVLTIRPDDLCCSRCGLPPWLPAALQGGPLRSIAQVRFLPLDSSLTDSVEWSQIGIEAVNSTQHRAIAHEAALQSLVLLKNENNGMNSSFVITHSLSVLPLKLGSRVTVLGPMGMTRDGLLSDYAADQLCWNNYDWYDHSHESFDCSIPVSI